MKHSYQKMLCLLIALTMLIGILPTGLFASAADVIVVNEGDILVDDDFVTAGKNDTVQTTVGGYVYQGVKGVTAFSTLNEALSKVSNGGSIYVGPGRYVENPSITTNVAIYGAGMNINPNNADWSANPKRTNLANESVLVGQLVVTSKALTKFVFNGFTITGQSTIKEATAGSTFKGIDICYNRFVNMVAISAANGAMYFTGTTVRTGRISYNRIEDATGAKPITFRNADDFTFSDNYINSSVVGIWLSAEVADQSKVPGAMKANVVRNYISGTDPFDCFLSYAESVDLTIADNTLRGTSAALYISACDTSTLNKVIKCTGNYLQGNTYDLRMVNSSGTASYTPSMFYIRNNVFNKGTITNPWLSTQPLDLSYNYFGNGPTYTGSPSPIVYPRYSNADMTAVLGEMKLASVSLTGTLASGVKESITGVLIDHDTNTVSLKETVDSIYQTIEVNATVENSGSSVGVKYYSDSACTNELTGGKVIDYLKKGNNSAYIKLTTSLDNYSYKIYTLNINRAASHATEVTSVQDYENTVSGNTISITIPSAVTSPNILLETAAGATYAFYTDEACTQKLDGTVLKDIKAGSSTYYVIVTAEDGTTTEKYTMLLTRAPSSEAEILKVNSPLFMEYDKTEDAYIGIYSSKYESFELDLTVSDRATWKLYTDSACTKEADPAKIDAKAGEVYYVKVSSESAAREKVYKFIFRVESAQASKEIYSVTGSVISSSVGKDTVTVSLKKDVTEYKPSFNYAGAYWKLYASYTGGVLSDPVSENTLKNLTGGDHTYYIQVVAQDGSSRVYTFLVNRKYATDCKLLTIGGGVSYYIDRFDYTAATTVQNEGEFMPAFTASQGATVKVTNKNGVKVNLPLTLRPGNSEYNIVVTAEDGITKNTYTWVITCIGEGYPVLTSGVAVSTAWDGLDIGTPVYPVINGKVYKAYAGETAFATITAAKKVVSSFNNTIYVMPGTVLDENVSLSSVKLYGANYNVDPVQGNRYTESVLSGLITVTGSQGAVSGFTFTQTGAVKVDSENSVTVSNNIFEDSALRTAAAISLTKSNTVYNKITINNNVMHANSDVALIALDGVLGVTISANVIQNTGVGAAVSVAATQDGSKLTISGNTFTTVGTAIQVTDVVRKGYLLVSENRFNGSQAVWASLSKADDAFVLNFYNNTVKTAAMAVEVVGAKAALAECFFANQNTFSSITKSVSVEYGSSVNTVGIAPLDITNNYYGVATPGNDAFDSNYNYKPYYVDSGKQYLSNFVHAVSVTVNGKPITDNGINQYAVVAQSTASVSAKIVSGVSVDPSAVGTVYVAQTPNTYISDSASIVMGARRLAYVTVFSLDETAKESYVVTLYPQTLNPVYNVYNVVSSSIEDMTVKVLVAHKATVWTPELEIEDGKAIALYSDEACTKAVNGNVKLPSDLTKVYGKVAGYETVTFEIYKKLSDEKSIFSMKDAYDLEYTGGASIQVSVDNRLAVADLTPVVSAGASFAVYSDAECLTETDVYRNLSSNATLYYKVTAADSSFKVFTVTVTRIDVVDPVILSIKNATTETLKVNSIVASIQKYSAKEGFAVSVQTNPGCTVKLYADAAHEYVLKNNTAYFSSNYVIFYAEVISPDGKKTQEYTVRLNKPAGSFTFADTIPGWAKAAVNEVKDLGIVNGTSTKNGVILDANGKTTREMMACFMIRMLGVDETQYSGIDLSQYYEDYEDISSWAVNSVKAATALGIFSGSASGGKNYIYAKNNITRQEFAAVFVRATRTENINVNSYNLKYKDASSIAAWAKNYVKIVTKLGFMKGDNGMFKPTNSITRAEIIQTIANYL